MNCKYTNAVSKLVYKIQTHACLGPKLYKTLKAKYTRNQKQRYQKTRYKPFILDTGAPRHPAAGWPRGSRSCRRERPAQRALGLPAARSPPAACSRRLLSAMGSRSRHSPGRWHTPASAQVHPGAAMREGRRFPRKRLREFRPPPPADGSGGSAERGASAAPAAEPPQLPGEGRLCGTRVS